MKLHLVGCSHHSSSVDIRERLAFTPDQAVDGAARLARRVSRVGGRAVVDVQSRGTVRGRRRSREPVPATRSSSASWPTSTAWTDRDVAGHMFQYSDADAVRHLFTVAASLDSMVVGEAQILSQVKQAFAVAQEQQMTGPVMHLAFEAAHRVAKRVATETDINRRRVSIPSVAVADFAKQLFETFHDKHVLLLGAGDMGEETLRYLRDEGARHIVILNRSATTREALAARVEAEVDTWEQLDDRLAWADLVVSTTSAGNPSSPPSRLPADSPPARSAHPVHPGSGRAARFRSGHRAVQQRVSLLHRRSEDTPANGTGWRAKRNGRKPSRSSRKKRLASWPT